MSNHHPFGPSSLERRHLCPGSYKLELNKPEKEGDDAARGHLLHNVLAKVLTNSLTPDDMVDIDPKDMEVLTWALDWFNMEVKPKVSAVTTEAKLSIDDGNGNELLSGTCDVICFTPDGNAVIADWKTGYNEQEDAPDNLQLAAYALGCHDCHKSKEVKVYLVYTSLNKVSTHTFTEWNAIRAFIKRIVAESLSPDAKLNPGEAQCRYCKALGECKAAIAHAQALMQAKFDESVPVLRWTNEQCALWWAKYKALEKFAENAVKPELMRRCSMESSTKGKCGGIYLKRGRVTPHIGNNALAWRMALEMGVLEEELVSMSRLFPNQLIDAMARKLCEKEPLTLKDARDRIKERLGDVYTELTASPSVAVEKGYIDIAVRKELES